MHGNTSSEISFDREGEGDKETALDSLRCPRVRSGNNDDRGDDGGAAPVFRCEPGLIMVSNERVVRGVGARGSEERQSMYANVDSREKESRERCAGKRGQKGGEKREEQSRGERGKRKGEA